MFTIFVQTLRKAAQSGEWCLFPIKNFNLTDYCALDVYLLGVACTKFSLSNMINQASPYEERCRILGRAYLTRMKIHDMIYQTV